jgi:hypothetical protein
VHLAEDDLLLLAVDGAPRTHPALPGKKGAGRIGFCDIDDMRLPSRRDLAV